MLHKEQNVQVCDATRDDSSNADWLKIKPLLIVLQLRFYALIPIL